MDRQEPARADSLPEPVVEDLLADAERRRVLGRLAAADEPVLVEDLAPAVLDAGDETDSDTVSSERRREARAALFEGHLPLLTATGVVEYDSMRNAVELVDDELAARLH